MHTTSITRTGVAAPSDRYANLTDTRLAAALADEDLAEETWLKPHERTTCHVHRRWLHDGVSLPCT